MKKGLITKLTGGLYTVLDSKSNSSVDIKARGKLRYHKIEKDSKFYNKLKGEKRHMKFEPKVGDIVMYDEMIDSIEPRKNDLTRPSITNIDQAILVFSAKEPDFSFNLLDKFICVIESHNVTPIIIINKIDLCNEKELEQLKTKLSYYENYYNIYYCSASIKEGIDNIKNLFKDKISIFTGQTGVGKSSLLNELNINLNLETGEISHALGRGKHTTRHTELIKVHDGFVADSPGFSYIDFKLLDITKEDIKQSFVDFFELSHECKFRTCSHINEPKCKVKEEVSNKNILEERYSNYVSFYNEVEE